VENFEFDVINHFFLAKLASLTFFAKKYEMQNFENKLFLRRNFFFSKKNYSMFLNEKFCQKRYNLQPFLIQNFNTKNGIKRKFFI
jgi:hypothetical protein